MRFIDKSKRYDKFDEYINKNTQHLSSTGEWNLPTDIKNKLHNHILKQQQGLCIYCQKELPEKEKAQHLPESIIEHLRPRTKYAELTYVFCNLSVACKKHKQKKDKKELIDFCEDRKDEEYDEDKFLNPHELVDIETYFKYDIEGNIFASNNESADYMIETVLNLSHSTLKEMRKTQYDIFLQMSYDDFNVVEEILSDDKSEKLPPFYSMLKFLF